MQPRFYNSEPAHRTPLSQWQRERMGTVQPMAHTSTREAFWTCVVVFAFIVIIAGVSL